MAIKCPSCGAEFDVTLFTFDRKIQCDCGAWVDMAVGHQQMSEQANQEANTAKRKPKSPIEGRWNIVWMTEWAAAAADRHWWTSIASSAAAYCRPSSSWEPRQQGSRSTRSPVPEPRAWPDCAVSSPGEGVRTAKGRAPALVRRHYLYLSLSLSLSRA